MTTKAHTRAELEAMKKGDLIALAETQGVAVTRGDGTEGDPTKDDYVAALASDSASSASEAPAVITSKSREKRADETIPGGSYIVNGKRVNAHGQLIDEKGTVLESE